MKKILLFTFLFALTGLIVAKHFEDKNKNQEKIVILQKISLQFAETAKKLSVTEPLLLVTGFNAEIDNLTTTELRTLYQKQKIYVWENLKPFADSVFDGNNTLIINDLRKFISLAKNNFLLIPLSQNTAQFKAISIDGKSFFRNPSQYPAYLLPQNQGFSFSEQITHIIQTGVTAITRGTGRTVDAKGVKFLTELIRLEFEGADYVHLSNEVSFKIPCEFKSGLQFCSKKEHFEALKDLNVNIVELTGNHNRDFGNTPYIETFKWYEANGMQIFGGGLTFEQANKPLIIKLKGGKSMAWVGYNELCPLNECATEKNGVGANAYKKDKAQKMLDSLKNILKIDVVLVSVQFGERNAYDPFESQARICKELADMGADMVCGSQAHQVQQIEFYKGKPIFYGFGNFLFDQVQSEGLRQGYFVHHYFYKGRLVQSIPVFTYTSAERRPSLANPAQIQAIKKAILLDKLIYK